MYLNIKAYFCDASAKAFMKLIKGHIRYYERKGAQLKDIRKLTELLFPLTKFLCIQKTHVS